MNINIISEILFIMIKEKRSAILLDEHPPRAIPDDIHF